MSEIQNQIVVKGEEILRRMDGQSKASIFSKDFWYGSIMEWSMKNEKFKTNMFRFVDVLPSLNSGNEVARHLKEYFSENGGELPAVFNVGLGLGSLAPGLMAGAIKKNVTSMATMFITGETPDEALPVLKKARKNKMTFTVDILGEATLSEKEAQEYTSKYFELINWLAKDAEKWDEVSQIDRDHEGAMPKVNVSIKMTALYSQISDKAWDESKQILKERMRPIFKLGMDKGVFINLDMEHYAVKHMTVEVFTELINEPEFKNYKWFGLVIQAYLRDSMEDIRNLTEFAKQRGTPFWIRLVKGAYWDSETIEAEQRGWAIPVYTKKAESDANYEACAKYLLENIKYIRPAFASHNVRTLAACMVMAEKMNIPKEALEFQMLYGMAEPIKKAVVDMGYRMREYAPVGELIPGMAYLVRRLLENTSNESWLRGKFADNKSTAELLKDPAQGLTPSSPDFTRKPGAFYNEPYLDFAISSNRQKLTAALTELKNKLPVQVPVIINNKESQGSQVFDRVNPSHNDQIVAKVQMASTEAAELAMTTAHNAWKSWKKVPATERAALVEKLAEIMKRDRFKLIAEQVLEVGKPWAEADADVAEAIDFALYYARHMRELSKPLKVGSVPGENSHYIYKSRGVTAVIAPWNFPLAILAGMVTAAAVAGNTVVMKPAEQSSLVGLGLMRMIIEAGFPAGVINFLPGFGEEVGEYIVNHKHTATIAFTGSKAVGLHILGRASKVQEGQHHVKRCIIEMGGKNAVIIDNDADLDEAVDGVLYSAFGFSGQKCSAGSRVIVLEEIYERFTERLVESAKSIDIKAAENPKAYMGPVVDKEAYDRLLAAIADGESKHKLLFKSSVPGGGYYVPATIFGDVKITDRHAQDEFFGPVISVIKVKDLNEAIEAANSVEYGLTGGIFSRSPAHIEQVRQELEVGNMYINRGITGAMVDRHPFGGFKMSGIGSKTGGIDYLKQYMEPICITENTMRRGFAPVEENT